MATHPSATPPPDLSETGPIPGPPGSGITLRRFTPADIARVAELTNDWDIARFTLTIPHPYTPADAEAWISRHAAAARAGEDLPLAIVRDDDGLLVGGVGLMFQWTHRRAELGYWVGREYRGRGYATAASRAMVRFAFETLGLARVYASHYTINPVSGRVLERVGMVREGLARQHVVRFGEPRDCVLYGMVRADYDRAYSTAPDR